MSDVEGLDKLLAKLDRLEGGASAGMGKIVLAGAERLVSVIKTSMSSVSHSGRAYRRGKRLHIASAPGETPAVDYGNLINSIQAQLLSATRVEAVAEAAVSAEAAALLEFGTAHMEARPFARPAVDEHEDEINAAATATLRELIEELAQ